MHSIQLAIWAVSLLVIVALLFDFMNGFHDAANSIATVVSTDVLKPQQAVAFAAVFNVIAYFVFYLKVAATVGKGTIDPAHRRSLRDRRHDRLECRGRSTAFRRVRRTH